MNKFALLFFIVLTSCGNDKSSEVHLLKPKEFQEKLLATPDAQLLDVRSMDEFKPEHLKGAINFDFNLHDQFNVLIAGLDKKKTYFVYCASGVRSAKAADKMHDLDFPTIYLLEGGIKAWKAEGREVKTSEK